MALAVVYSRALAGLDAPLARVDLPKESGRFDLPIAVGILAAHGTGFGETARCARVRGRARPVGRAADDPRRALAMTHRAHRDGRAFVPSQSVAEAALARRATVLPVHTLLEVYGHLTGNTTITPHSAPPQSIEPSYPDLADVRGQAHARRALEVAAAGAPSLLNL
jgi:magnesium chelatase family protein